MNEPSTRSRRATRTRQGGAAAVEAAIVMVLLVTFLTFPVFYARIFWHYTVANKAAQDAARYLSTVSAREMASRTLSKAAGDLAIEIARTEIAELGPETRMDAIVVYCGVAPCGSNAGITPSTVKVTVTLHIFDTFFGVVDTGRDGWTLTADVTLPYVGT